MLCWEMSGHSSVDGENIEGYFHQDEDGGRLDSTPENIKCRCSGDKP